MNQMLRTTDLAITGMSCASCVSRVEASLRKVAGVSEVAVNLATETAHIESSGAAAALLIAAVERAGYHATLQSAAKPFDGRRELFELIAAALFSTPLIAAMFLPIPAWAELALATPVQFWLGARFYRGGFNALRHRAGNMDLLVALGTSAAYLLSLADYVRATGPLYFESSAAVITFIRLGKFLEGKAKRDAARAVTGLAALRPPVAHRGTDGSMTDVPQAALRLGDIVEIRPGERLPVDGTIISGAGSLDESHITGESLPVLREAGGNVLAGSLNLDGVLRIRATTEAGETFLDRMARLIGAAQASAPAVQKLADRAAAIFVPVVLAIAALAFAAWLLAGAKPDFALIAAVSVLVIACPCALGLATPAAILAATGAAARHGILIRNADALQHAAKVDLVIFDKTGTLTLGRPKLVQTWPLAGLSSEYVLTLAASLAAADTHPLAAALRRPGAVPAEKLRSLPGRGVEGHIAGARYLLGAAALLKDAGGKIPELAAPPGATLSYLASADGTPLAAFAFADSLRPDAAAAIARLRMQGCAVMLLSGDNPDAAETIGQALGITDIVAEASPSGKFETIRARRAAGHVIAMVGDGVNDAAALAAADLGIAMGSGADMAIEAADISLLRPLVTLIPDTIALSRRGWRILWQGLFWAVIFNAIGIPLAAFGLLNPSIAGAAMAASSVAVLANALRLRNWQPA